MMSITNLHDVIWAVIIIGALIWAAQYGMTNKERKQ